MTPRSGSTSIASGRQGLRRFAVGLAVLGSLQMLCSPPEAAAGSARSATISAVATLSPQQAVNSAATFSSARGISSYVTVLDRSNGRVLARTGSAGTQVASESIVKLFIAGYYRVRYGSTMSSTMNAQLSQMIRCSDDGIASAYWTSRAVPEMAGRYGMTRTSNNPGNPGYWGKTRITADDVGRFLYRMSKDPAVGPWLMPLMAQATDLGCDGFNQNFGVNAIAGSGSKQGWGSDNWTGQPNAVHSVGFTGRYLLAILQTGNPGSYAVMPGVATHTAKLIVASVVPPPYPRYPKDSADRFTGSLYRQLLNRTVTSPPQSIFLQQGTHSREQVSAGIAGSRERRSRLVNAVYVDCLRRPADSGGSSAWASRLGTGSLLSLYAGLCASTEAYNRAGRQPVSWARNTLRALWRIEPSAGQVSFWAGWARREGLTSAVVRMTADFRYRRQWIDRSYLAMLGRPADSGALAHIRDNMSARGAFSLPVTLSLSAEYWNRYVH